MRYKNNRFSLAGHCQAASGLYLDFLGPSTNARKMKISVFVLVVVSACAQGALLPPISLKRSESEDAQDQDVQLSLLPWRRGGHGTHVVVP